MHGIILPLRYGNFEFIAELSENVRLSEARLSIWHKYSDKTTDYVRDAFCVLRTCTCDRVPQASIQVRLLNVHHGSFPSSHSPLAPVNANYRENQY